MNDVVMFQVWKNVADSERRDIYEDCVFNLAKREKEEGKARKKRNMRELASILDSMVGIEYRTTWQEAQQMLLDNPNFVDDASLLGMFNCFFKIISLPLNYKQNCD